MFGLGMQELMIILVVVVVLFGATKLPQVGDGMGKMISNFRKSMKAAKEETDEESKKEINEA